jgi:hypothetical protein
MLDDSQPSLDLPGRSGRSALTIHQPWAFLIVRPDITDPAERARLRSIAAIKDVENRTWPTRARGEVYVHAGKHFDIAVLIAFREYCRQGWGMPPEALQAADLLLEKPELMQLGGIIGTMTIGTCSRTIVSPWKAQEGYGFGLTDSKPLPFRPYRGMQGFFPIPDEIQDA